MYTYCLYVPERFIFGVKVESYISMAFVHISVRERRRHYYCGLFPSSSINNRKNIQLEIELRRQVSHPIAIDHHNNGVTPLT